MLHDTAGRPTPHAVATIGVAQQRVRSATVDWAALVQSLTVAAVAFGITLRTWQYLSAPSLFWGEIALARNIEARGLLQLLTERTAFGQGTSPGYLLVQDVITSLFGSSELTQRFFPFLASVLALLMFGRIAGLYLQGMARLLAVACFALGFPFLFLLSPFKALCSVDTAATMAMFLLSLETLKSSFSTKRAWLLGLAGFALIWFSEAATIMVAAVALALAGDALLRRDWKRITQLVPMFALWSIAAVGALMLEHQITDSATRESLRLLYTGAEPPAFPDVMGQVTWLYKRLTEALGPAMFHYRMPTIALGAIVLGLFTLRNVDRQLRALLLAPIATALIAAAAGWYIFQGFYIAFLFPYFFVLFARGAEQFGNIVSRIARITLRERDDAHDIAQSARAVVMTGWMAVPIAGFAAYLPTYKVAETKSVLRYIGERRQPDDRMYGISTTSHAIAYYAPKVGLNPSEFVVGACHLGEPRKTLQELDQFRGQSRVWVMFTHDLARYNLRGEALNYLNRIGTARDSIVLMPPSIPTLVTGASAYLYDLSDAAKLKSATADSVPLLRQAAGTRNNACGTGLLSSEVP